MEKESTNLQSRGLLGVTGTLIRVAIERYAGKVEFEDSREPRASSS